MRRNPLRLRLGVLAAWAVTAVVFDVHAAEPGKLAVVPGNAGESLAVLDNNSLWRCFKAFKHTDVRTTDGKLVTRSIRAYWGGIIGEPSASTAWSTLPPSEWTVPEFDDAYWPRVRLSSADSLHTDRRYDLALITLRGKFEVKDPAQVKDMILSLGYYGGVVAHINGKEVARGHVTSDKPGLEALAEDYSMEAFTTVDGKLLRPQREYVDEKSRGRLALRERKLADVRIPGAVLRKGVNVLAIEVHRAAVPELVGGGKGRSTADANCAWVPIELFNAKLSASPASAVVANARPDGTQVWSCLPVETRTVADYGDPCEPLRPVALAAARNGVFSGRLMVSSAGPIKGLKVSVSDLAQAEGGSTGSPHEALSLSKGGGKIPAAAVRVRCAEPAVPEKSAVPPLRFDGLLDTIPAEIPVVGAAPNAGAMAPLWLTLRVPKDAKPGRYEGTVNVAAEGLKPTAVPLRVNVSAWTLPDPKDFRITNFGQSSPDSLAKHYQVPLWSDKHFELISKSMALMAELNSRNAIAELCVDFYGLAGNAESMVRWIKQPDLPGEASAKTGGSYKYDFTVFDKYLETVAKTMGKPRPLRLACWGEWQRPGSGRVAWDMPTRKVTLLDPATGKLDTLEQPPADKPEFLAFWKPVLDEIRKKIEARGWFDVTTMQHNSYCMSPHVAIIDTYQKIWPDGCWSYTAHNGTLGAKLTGTDKKSAAMPVTYADAVWTCGTPTVRGAQALIKPRTPGNWCCTFRGLRDTEPLSGHWWLAGYREIPEREISMGHDGYSDFGVDFFPIKKAQGKGHYIVGNGRGTGGPGDGTLALLAPGPDGPVATERFEAVREGLEIAEAILFLERALQENKIGGDLARRVNRHLDERGGALLSNWYNARLADDEKLLELAGEAAAAIQGRS